jgi:flagellar motor switch protein FliG
MPAVAPAPVTTNDFSRMSKIQKLAVLLVVIGDEAAGQILKSLSDDEVESICGEMTKLGLISRELQQEVLKEFSEVAMEAGTSLCGGVHFAKSALERARGAFKASYILSRVSPSSSPVASTDQIVDLEPSQLFNLIRHEQPQAIALILSFLTPEKSARVLRLLPVETRGQVVERIATLAPTSAEVVERVVSVLHLRLGAKQTSAPVNRSGGVKVAATLLNSLDKSTSKALLHDIDQRNPELGNSIREKMFTFEDLATLNLATLQRIVREIEMRTLAMALINSNENVKSAMMGAVSRRAAETVNEEMASLSAVSNREIEAARLSVIEVVRRLEAEEEIKLGEDTGGANDAP